MAGMSPALGRVIPGCRSELAATWVLQPLPTPAPSYLPARLLLLLCKTWRLWRSPGMLSPSARCCLRASEAAASLLKAAGCLCLARAGFVRTSAPGGVGWRACCVPHMHFEGSSELSRVGGCKIKKDMSNSGLPAGSRNSGEKWAEVPRVGVSCGWLECDPGS